MTLTDLVKSKRAAILSLASKHGAQNIRVFGSVARGEASPQSDIDFLVEFEPKRSLLDMGGLQMDLQDLLGVHVDLAEPEGLHHRLRDQILKEARPL